jgi:hypothetical protein
VVVAATLLATSSVAIGSTTEAKEPVSGVFPMLNVMLSAGNLVVCLAGDGNIILGGAGVAVGVTSMVLAWDGGAGRIEAFWTGLLSTGLGVWSIQKWRGGRGEPTKNSMTVTPTLSWQGNETRLGAVVSF